MKYKVIEASSSESLTEIIESFLRQGWVCHGGVSITRWERQEPDGNVTEVFIYAQAMTIWK